MNIETILELPSNVFIEKHKGHYCMEIEQKINDHDFYTEKELENLAIFCRAFLCEWTRIEDENL